MVQKFCPQCKDWIPVACKTCPCGHKFIKTTATKDRSKFEIEALSTATSRKENGRPQRLSAMNSLYYHSALHVSSYKLTKHAAAVSAKKKKKKNKESSTSQASSSSTSTKSDNLETANGESSPKRKKGRPPRLSKIIANTSQPKRPEIAPYLRTRITQDFIESSNLSNHSNESDSRNNRVGRTVSESESYNKLYKGLTEEQKKHYAIILAEINSKFCRNANFPL